MEYRGLIPACAGQTKRAYGPGGWLSAHPRVCGADLVLHQRHGRVGGLIPACAGQTLRAGAATRHDGAHPRVCGADISAIDCDVRSRGSSPRVRGRLPSDGADGGLVRLIPACAGQTGRDFRAELATTAHPRVCGADAARWASWPRYSGSSPRVRGRPLRNIGRHLSSGLIPACAGQTRYPR